MKAIFQISTENYSTDQLDKIAEKYSTTTQYDDDGVSRFILVEPKLQITERSMGDKYTYNVWGASQKDIDFLKSILGDPARTAEQRLTPLEFAQELIAIPGITEKSKEEIMEIMEVNERQYLQYQKLIKNQLRRSNAADLFIKAAEILQK